MSRIFGLSFASILVIVLALCGCSRSKLMDRALRLEQQGQPEKALQLYQAQLKKTSPSDHAALAELEFHIGESFLAMDRSREAFAAYNQAIAYDSSHRMAHLRLGEMYLLSGAADRAAEQAQAVLNHSGKNLDALALLGAAASASGNAFSDKS